MTLKKFTRILPTKNQHVWLNPEQVIWVQESGLGTTIFVAAGEPVEVTESCEQVIARLS